MHTARVYSRRTGWNAPPGRCPRQHLLCYSRPVEIERRVQTRRTSDVELLLKSLLSAKAA